MIWATVSSQSCSCWLCRASLSLAAKKIINLILMLVIWWCPCVESSIVLLEEGVCCDQCVLLAKLLLAFASYPPIKKRIGCLILESTGLGWLRALARGSNDVTGCHLTLSSSQVYSILVPFSGRLFFSIGINRFIDSHPISLGNSTRKSLTGFVWDTTHYPVNVISQEILGDSRPDLGHMFWWVESIPLKL